MLRNYDLVVPLLHNFLIDRLKQLEIGSSTTSINSEGDGSKKTNKEEKSSKRFCEQVCRVSCLNLVPRTVATT